MVWVLLVALIIVTGTFFVMGVRESDRAGKGE